MALTYTQTGELISAKRRTLLLEHWRWQSINGYLLYKRVGVKFTAKLGGFSYSPYKCARWSARGHEALRESPSLARVARVGKCHGRDSPPHVNVIESLA